MATGMVEVTGGFVRDFLSLWWEWEGGGRVEWGEQVERNWPEVVLCTVLIIGEHQWFESWCCYFALENWE